jgi:hypothetical protein
MPGAIRIDFWNRIPGFSASARIANDVFDGFRMRRNEGQQLCIESLRGG